MSLPYDEYARDQRDEWRQAERDAEREEEARDAFDARWGCDDCDGKGRVPCSCNYVDNGFDGCDACDGNSYVDCESCEGKGHHFRPRWSRLPSDID